MSTFSDFRVAVLATDGFEESELTEPVKALKAAGLDYIDVSSGNITPESRWPNDPGFNVPAAERVRRECGIPVRAVGLITTAKQAAAIVAEGRADMVALARGFLDEQGMTPTFTNLSGMTHGIREAFTYRKRHAHGTQHPLHTLQTTSGTCRDSALFMTEALRKRLSQFLLVFYK